MQKFHSDLDARDSIGRDFKMALAAFKCHFHTREVPSKSSVRQSSRTAVQASKVERGSESVRRRLICDNADDASIRIADIHRRTLDMTCVTFPLSGQSTVPYVGIDSPPVASAQSQDDVGYRVRGRGDREQCGDERVAVRITGARQGAGDDVDVVVEQRPVFARLKMRIPRAIRR